jgi:DTW domain-containing protein
MKKNQISSSSIAESKQRKRADLALEVPAEPQPSSFRWVVLQHPQEPDVQLGSAALLVRCLKGAELKVGLSWRNHRAALGEDCQPSQWWVLNPDSKLVLRPGEFAVTQGKARLVEPNKPAGIVLLDGTWSQGKALWWRNPWLLKLKRVTICPASPSLYGSLRREPRAGAVSTIEAAAELARFLGEKENGDYLRNSFSGMLREYRARKAAARARPATPEEEL